MSSNRREFLARAAGTVLGACASPPLTAVLTAQAGSASRDVPWLREVLELAEDRVGDIVRQRCGTWLNRTFRPRRSSSCLSKLSEHADDAPIVIPEMKTRIPHKWV